MVQGARDVLILEKALDLNRSPTQPLGEMFEVAALGEISGVAALDG